MAIQNYYQELGVAENADQQTIKRAYRRLARKYHPDVNPSPNATEKFKQLTEAYDTLTNPNRRAKYDRQLHPQNQFNHQNPFDDFFNQFFTESGQEPNMPIYGDDLQINLTINFAESVTGKQVTVTYPREEIHQGHRTTTNHKLAIKIPAGIDNNQQIRLAGQGNAGYHGGPPGDVFVTIRVTADPKFKRRGADIETSITLNFIQAILGTKVQVPTPYGPVSLKIPRGTQPQQRFRLKNRGMPKLNQHGRGDEFVTVIVQLPKKITPLQKRFLIQSFSKTAHHS
ncbi:DnaJ C-terminal domain-containing protein [Lentilactobacillus raoultii]|uniref:DnaJ C-terminal domain-containing protein n=1 Tax=Lentilactobacillus raoultii TaxID=1987503 RepID=A0ABW3PF28_9LACO